jgi:hypothetical protein
VAVVRSQVTGHAVRGAVEGGEATQAAGSERWGIVEVRGRLE